MPERRPGIGVELSTNPPGIRGFVTILLFSVLLGAACSPVPETSPPEKSEAEIAWEEEVGRDVFHEPAFAYVDDDPDLPRILLIGDSISIQYTSAVRDLLKGKANVHRIPKNGENTMLGLDNMEIWLRGEKWDLIHFNWGLHDIYRADKYNESDVALDKAVLPRAYAQNLLELVARLKQTNAKLIWATTTPVPVGALGFIPGEEIKYNAIAETIMTKENVAINDLHAHILPRIGTLQRRTNIHFHSEGSDFLAKKIADTIQNALESPD